MGQAVVHAVFAPLGVLIATRDAHQRKYGSRRQPKDIPFHPHRTLPQNLDPEPFAFGVWFGDESPVDISGPPAAILPRTRGLDHYQHYFRQTAPRWVAVAAFAGDHRSQPTELSLEWSDARLGTPERQWATERIR